MSEPPWVILANIIREVDGNHDLGAGEMAQRIVRHPRFSLAAQPESAGLDVERLAQALNDTDHRDCLGWDDPKAGCRGYYRRMALIALAEYARLTAEKSPEHGIGGTE